MTIESDPLAHESETIFCNSAFLDKFFDSWQMTGAWKAGLAVEYYTVIHGMNETMRDKWIEYCEKILESYSAELTMRQSFIGSAGCQDSVELRFYLRSLMMVGYEAGDTVTEENIDSLAGFVVRSLQRRSILKRNTSIETEAMVGTIMQKGQYLRKIADNPFWEYIREDLVVSGLPEITGESTNEFDEFPSWLKSVNETIEETEVDTLDGFISSLDMSNFKSLKPGYINDPEYNEWVTEMKRIPGLDKISSARKPTTPEERKNQSFRNSPMGKFILDELDLSSLDRK